jgi:hypothetical protein
MRVAQIGRSLCNESAIRMTEGHEQMRDLVDRFLNRFASTQQTQAT